MVWTPIISKRDWLEEALRLLPQLEETLSRLIGEGTRPEDHTRYDRLMELMRSEHRSYEDERL